MHSGLFDKIREHIPVGSVVIELLPNGFSEKILNRSPKKNVLNIDLVSKNHEDGLDYLLSALGK